MDKLYKLDTLTEEEWKALTPEERQADWDEFINDLKPLEPMKPTPDHIRKKFEKHKWPKI